MGENVTFRIRPTYLLCHFTGPCDLPALIELTRTVREYCNEHGHRRVLVDVRESHGTFSVLARYRHAVEIAKPGWLGIRVAIVARPDQVLPDRFWETATRNRGLDTRVVTDSEEGVAWLGSGDP
jgi:hypothetical protein